MAKQKPLRFQVPVEASVPPLVSNSAGFTRLLARPAQGHRMEVTVLDSHDARLLRASIIVARRRCNEEPGEWYVSAPGWPGLPDEASYALDGSGELPRELRRQLSWFVRHEPLTAFATMVCDRHEYVLRGGDDDLVDIRDDTIRIVRDNIELPETREITMTPRAKLAGQQRDFIVSALEAIDASPMGAPPTLQQRIGPPATGLTSFRPPEGIDSDMNLEEFVSEVLLNHLYELVIAELKQEPEEERVEIDKLSHDLRGLAPVLEPAWRDELETDLRTLASSHPGSRDDLLLGVIDALVGAVRAPKLGNMSTESARVALNSRMEHALMILFDRCRALELDGPDEAWGAALRSALQLQATNRLLEPLFGKPARKLDRELGEVIDLLRSSVSPPDGIEVAGLSPEEAFQLGRDVEHAQWNVVRARRTLIDTWPEHVAKGRKALKKMRKKLR
ncbi:hypothetical protein [uncultured Tessaracoccus sp.]|uniref:hypothetical protein n=1 Tax=uncultured Tessaracoccus sp. TaxID=905023 RepID=UPI0026062456|nr:hypothetical protein [uncultured Tessaracoccus sp.]